MEINTSERSVIDLIAENSYTVNINFKNSSMGGNSAKMARMAQNEAKAKRDKRKKAAKKAKR